MKQSILAMCIAAIMLLSISTLNAQPVKPDFRKGNANTEHFSKRGHKGEMFAKLLTAEQKEAFKEIRMQSMKESKPLQDKLRELKAHHQTLITAEQPNLKEINASIDKMSDVKAELAKVRTKSRIEMASHLTDEQKMKMANKRMMMKKHRPQQGNRIQHVR